ncbi:MAG TPA: transglutaminase-like domain-containing protein [Candidatus Brachybacterium merdigallinarum]|nr:transglutaminase-like domain-containing protein [Candidatus Brachybacterium merdigallinarum]
MSTQSTTARPGTGRSTYFASLSVGRHVVNIAVIAVLFLLGLVGFHTVYGGVQYLLTGMMGLFFGTLIALIGARWRWGPLRTAPLVLAVYFLFGSMFAAPTHALFGIIPTLGSLKELLTAPVTSWKATLTVAPPVGSAQGVLVVVWISMLLLSLLGMTIVLRTRRYVIAWLFPLVLLLVTILFGTTEAVSPVIRGVLFALISVAWLTWRFESARLDSAESTIISDTVRPGSWKNPVLRRRVIGGAVIMAISAGAAVSAQSLLDPPAGAGRYALRDQINPPFDPYQYVSPLADFRGYIKNQRDTELFTVTGVEAGEQIRLATLDQYDLQVYNVASSRQKDGPSGAFLRTASGVDLEEPSGSARTTTVTIGDYTDVWLPTVGREITRIDIGDMEGERYAVTSENLFLNQQSQTAVNAAGLQPGDSYDLTYEPYTAPAAEDTRSATFADLALPDNATLDPSFAQLAEEWAGTSDSDYERFEFLTRAIKADAFYSHGIDDDAASLSGHGAARIMAMLEEVGFDEEQSDAAPTGKIGDEEQFAVLTALMARSIGIPARVVMGFEVPEGVEGTAAITGEDVTAWVEVAFEELGWVRFDPAPDDDEDPTQPQPKEVEKPLPQVAQPPPPPAEPPNPPPGAMSDDSQNDEPEPEGTVSWVVYVGLGLLPFVLLGIALAAIVLAKVRRRSTRRRQGVLPEQIDGGWQEVLDHLTDLGMRPDPLMTRLETAAHLQGQIPALSATTLAARADRAVFGPDDLPPGVVDEYWGEVMAARRTMSRSVPWHRRLRAVFSLRSFRRRSAERRALKRRERSARRARAVAQKRTDALRRRRASTSSTTKTPRKGPSR